MDFNNVIARRKNKGVYRDGDKVIKLNFDKGSKVLQGEKIIVLTNGHNFVGTLRYASLNSHKGIRQSRRDDLESMLYILIYFLKGKLPWQDVKAKNKEERYKVI